MDKIIFFGESRGSIKGFDLFVDCLERFREEAVKLDLVVALFGSGKSPAILHDIARVIELGYLDEKGLRVAYSGADLFVIPSREDNFPNVIFEALACGLPYVGFDSGGVGDMIRENPMCGRVAPALDLSMFFEAIKQLSEEQAEDRVKRRSECRATAIHSCVPLLISSCYLEEYHCISL